MISVKALFCPHIDQLLRSHSLNIILNLLVEGMMNEVFLLGVILLCLWIKQIIMFKPPIQDVKSI